MARTKLIAVLGIVTAAVATAVLVGAAASHADVRSRAGTIAHFAGFPPVGVKASRPRTGRLLLGLRQANATWSVYADGRIIWQKWTPSGDATVVPDGARTFDTGYVQQRLTLEGVQLLRSKILSTGLFEHNLRLALGRGHNGVLHQVRRGNRMVTVNGVPVADPTWTEHFTKATPAQTRALWRIKRLIDNPAAWLPTSAWADRQIRAFVPSHYETAFDRSYPDISKLPSPAGEVLSQYKQLGRHGGQLLTTGQARALLQAFVEAGISPSENHAFVIAFDFAGLGLPHPSDLHLSPALPGG